MNNIIVTNDYFILLGLILFPFVFLGIVLLLIYNKFYIMKNYKSFIFTFLGQENSKGSNMMKEHLPILGNIFLLCINIDYFLKRISSKTVFPKNGNKDKPLKLFPNSYEDNVNIFKKVHYKWICTNNITNILLFSAFFSYSIIYCFKY